MDRKTFCSNLQLIFKGHFFNPNSISLIKCELVMSIQFPTYPHPVACVAGDRYVENSKDAFDFHLSLPFNEA